MVLGTVNSDTSCDKLNETMIQRFRVYFDREVAQKAAHSLSNGVEVEIELTGEHPEIFTFTKAAGKNQIKDGSASSPQLILKIPPQAAELILNDPANEVGTIGVTIAKLVISSDPERRIRISLKAGIFSLLTHGYLGVVTSGGAQFATYLASRGLNGMGAIKDALKRLKD